VTQVQLLVLLLKIFLISGFVTLTGWIVLYTCLAPWWRNPVGRTLVTKTALIAALFVPTTLNLFFNFSRFDSEIAAWIQVVLIGLVTPVMCWRSLVWIKLHRSGRLPRNGHDG
jgi:hypothetical protein